LTASEVDQLANFEYESTSFLGSGDTYSSTTSEIYGPFISKDSQRSKDGVSVDAQDCREVNRWGESFTGLDFAIRDGLSDLRGDLIMKGELLRSVHLDIQHGAK
jgi:hypothetical protein